MFDVGWSEMVVVGAVALIVIGPKDLPAALRSLGQSIAKVRRMAGEFKQQFDDAMREAEVDKIKQDLAKAEADARAAADFNFNPVETAKQEIQAAIEDAGVKAEPHPMEAPPAEAIGPPIEIAPPNVPDVLAQATPAPVTPASAAAPIPSPPPPPPAADKPALKNGVQA